MGRSAVAGALLAVMAVALPASAGFTPTKVIRTAPVQRVVRVGDIATAGSRVAVVWTEIDHATLGGGFPEVYLRTSADRGRTWGPVVPVHPFSSSAQPSAAICAGRHLMVAYAVHDPTPESPQRWFISLYRRDLVTGAQAWAQVSEGTGRAQYPDVACASDRVWVAWDDLFGGQRHILLRHGIVGAPGAITLAPAISLGRSRPTGGAADSGPSVAAVKGRGYVAWSGWHPDGVEIRFKRFSVGAGPGHPVTPHPTTGLRTMGSVSRHPLVAASGKRVTVIHGTGSFDRFRMHRSTDRGASFGSQKVVRLPSPLAGEAVHLSRRGTRILVIVDAYLKGPAGTVRYLSTDNGNTFTRTHLAKAKGTRVGGFGVQGGTPRAVEAWDGHWYNVRKLRFRRDT